MTRGRTPSGRHRGGIDELPSGACGVRVYAGNDPLTRRRNYLTEIVPAGRTAMREAEKLRTRLLNQVDEQRQPRTKANVNQLLDRHPKCCTSTRTPRRATAATSRITSARFWASCRSRRSTENCSIAAPRSFDVAGLGAASETS